MKIYGAKHYNFKSENSAICIIQYQRCNVCRAIPWILRGIETYKICVITMRAFRCVTWLIANDDYIAMFARLLSRRV